jgi:predicted O-methyltransferase YrrM
MVHIDGNHDYTKVESDIRNYVPKLKVGGFLIIDDIGWDSIAPQYAELKKRMKLFYEEYDDSIKNGWGILIKV